MLGQQRSAVVVVARVAPHDVRVALCWQRTDYIRQRIVRQPAQAVVVGLARPHPVTGTGWGTILAVGVEALARVIPRRQQRASRADRQVRLPLRTRRGISVQLQRRAKGHTAIGGTNVIDVARVAARALLGIDQGNNVVEGSGLTPALVPPVAAVSAKYPGEVTRRTHARSRKGCASVSVAPGSTAISRLEEEVSVVVRKTTAAFVHAGDIQSAVARHVTGDLCVADEGTGVDH